MSGGAILPCNKKQTATLSIQSLDLKQATKTSRRVVGFRTVVIDEDSVVATITKESAAEFSNF